ncbi:MAG: hypothetical protein ACTH58_15705 [Marinomonas foliarum]|uniref:hypothetical protein n=1 Tax=Marinomonas foliarum TaxID=491950 RepID=UPI003F9C6B1C
MENILIPNRKLHEEFLSDLMMVKAQFEPRLTSIAKKKLEDLEVEIREILAIKNKLALEIKKKLALEIKKKDISFSNNLFGRRSIIKILEEVSEVIIKELLKDDILNFENIIKDNLKIPVKTNEKGKSIVDGYYVELYITKVRNLCFLIDH